MEENKVNNSDTAVAQDTGSTAVPQDTGSTAVVQDTGSTAVPQVLEVVASGGENSSQESGGENSGGEPGRVDFTGNKPSKKPLIIALAAVTALVVTFCAAGAIYIYGGNTVKAGVVFTGCDLGGYTFDEAHQTIQTIINETEVPTTLDISISGETFAINTLMDKADFDSEAIAKQVFAIGREGSPIKRFQDIGRAKRGEFSYSFNLDVDTNGLKEQIDQVAAELAQKSYDDMVFMRDGKLYFNRSRTDLLIDTSKLLTQVTTKLNMLDFSTVEYTPVAAEVSRELLTELKTQVDTTAAEPTLDLARDPSGNTVKPGVVGIELDVDGGLAALKASKDEVVELPVRVINPKMSDKDYKARLFTDVLSSQSTNFNGNMRERTTNVRIAAEDCNRILLPGQEFSYFGQIGRVTREKGYKDATVFANGSVEEGLGGGVCQVSSTIYMAAIHADLKITERRNHSLQVVYTPIGQDATFANGGPDLRFVNNTGYPVKIALTVGSSTLTVKVIGTQTVPGKTVKIATSVEYSEPYQTKEVLDPSLKPGQRVVKNIGYNGTKSVSYRVVYVDGKEVSRTHENTSTYKRLDKLIHVGPAATDPVVPEKPVDKPEKPVVPEKPVDKPEEPVVPEKPADKPEDPVVPEKPADKPEDPVVPEKPEDNYDGPPPQNI